MPSYFYLARCGDGSLYSGSCVDLSAREAAHNDGRGAKYTRSRRPVRIVFSEKFATLGEARKREAQVKTWTKLEKEKLAALTESSTGMPRRSAYNTVRRTHAALRSRRLPRSSPSG